MENPIKMDDLGVPLFLETPKWCYFTLLINNDLVLRLVGVPLYASVVARVSLVVADEIVGETQPATEGGRRSVEGEIKETICVSFAGPN